MLNIGAGELIFILVVALLVLGPTRLPEFARTLGRFLREFRRRTDEVRTVVEREFYRMDQDILQDDRRPRPAPPIPEGSPSPVPSLAPEAVRPEGTAGAPGGQAQEPAAAGAESPQPPASTAPADPTAPPADNTARADAPPRFEPPPGTMARNAPEGG